MAVSRKFTFAQKTCVSAVGKLMQHAAMISPGARVGVAVSGGVDSFTLLHVLRIRQRIVPFHFDLMALHVNAGFDPGDHAPLAEYCRTHGLAAHLAVTDFGPRAHSPENRESSPCFFCAMLRRKKLFDLCREYGLTHLAMGHNADDLVTTFFMNLVQNGRVDGLAHKESYFQGRLQVIRPALGVEKQHIRAAARQWGLPVWENVCPSNGHTRRDEIGAWAASAWRNNKRIKNNIYNALRRFQLDLG
ncbi:MAG: ATP-binding protein [Desulfovibrionaceae bacterium]